MPCPDSKVAATTYSPLLSTGFLCAKSAFNSRATQAIRRGPFSEEHCDRSLEDAVPWQKKKHAGCFSSCWSFVGILMTSLPSYHVVRSTQHKVQIAGENALSSDGKVRGTTKTETTTSQKHLSLVPLQTMDTKLNDLASRVVESNRSRDEVEDDDAVFAELEAEIENDENAAFRERGLEQLRLQADKLKHMQANAYGTYSEIVDEKEVVRISAHEPRCVIHFYHSNFKRCEIMDRHLAKLASKYSATRFLRVFVENVPWLVQRLGIKVLPCVMSFVGGVMKDRLIGFEEIGNSDVFETAVLELRLSQSGVLQKAEDQLGALSYSIAPARNLRTRTVVDDDVFDLDD
ncbi:thioredoxin-like protein [Pisolithus albus]|nr:thioredoxin-like protein [Pisolithus albus]